MQVQEEEEESDKEQKGVRLLFWLAPVCRMNRGTSPPTGAIPLKFLSKLADLDIEGLKSPVAVFPQSQGRDEASVQCQNRYTDLPRTSERARRVAYALAGYSSTHARRPEATSF